MSGVHRIEEVRIRLGLLQFVDQELDRVGKALRPYLDAGAENVKPGVAYRLAEARRAAIASLEAQPASATVVSGGQ